MYIEQKTGYGDSGPAWISHVAFSKSGSTIYFNGKALKRMHGGGIAGNFAILSPAMNIGFLELRRKEQIAIGLGQEKFSSRLMQ